MHASMKYIPRKMSPMHVTLEAGVGKEGHFCTLESPPCLARIQIKILETSW